MPSKQDRAFDRIKSILDKTSDNIGGNIDGFAVRTLVRVHANRDGTVDGELLVPDIPRGLRVLAIFSAIHQAMLQAMRDLRIRSLNTKELTLWISNGIRRVTSFNPTRDKEDEIEEFHYERWRGRVGAGTYYQRATVPKLATNFDTAIDIERNMRGKRRRKAEQVYTRLHWTPENKKPTRR